MHKEMDLEFELHAYVDGDLDEDAMGRVEEYLARNPETALKIRSYLQQKDDLRVFARTRAADEEPAALHALGRKLARRLKPGSLFPWRRAMVMTLLLATGWLAHVIYVPLTEDPEYTRELLQAHLMTAADPAEILPLSPERMDKLFARINEMERLPDFRHFGFEAIGAQLLPTGEGMLLHVPYHNSEGTVVSWFLLHDEQSAEQPLRVIRAQDVSILSWQHDHSRFAIAAALDDQRLSQLAQHFESSF